MPRPGLLRPRLVADEVYDRLTVLIVDGHIARYVIEEGPADGARG